MKWTHILNAAGPQDTIIETLKRTLLVNERLANFSVSWKHISMYRVNSYVTKFTQSGYCIIMSGSEEDSTEFNHHQSVLFAHMITISVAFLTIYFCRPGVWVCIANHSDLLASELFRIIITLFTKIISFIFDGRHCVAPGKYGCDSNNSFLHNKTIPKW